MADPIRLRKVRLRQNPPRLSLFPDFLIVGPQRTGTTWLYRNLRQHPRIFLPDVKETYYFSTLGNSHHPRYQFDYLEDYLVLFKESPWRFLKKTYDCIRKSGALYLPKIRGEATATYATLDGKVISEITTLNPEIRIILMLRDPIERAWSHAKKDLLRKKRSGAPVLDEEYKEFLSSPSQRRLADYPAMVKAWTAHLKPGHLFLGDSRKVSQDPEALLREITDFLGVTPHALSQNRHLTELINPTDDSEMSEDLRIYLKDLYAAELAGYQDLLEQTLSNPL